MKWIKTEKETPENSSYVLIKDGFVYDNENREYTNIRNIYTAFCEIIPRYVEDGVEYKKVVIFYPILPDGSYAKDCLEDDPEFWSIKL